jgi:serine/threonine-protein kinase
VAIPPPRPERAASSGGDIPRPRVNKLRLLSPDDPNRLLDPYELVGEIASGGMATVYLGRLAGPSGFQRLVAIKRLHPHLAREEQFVEMFLDEARLAAGIHHPHVVPILEVGQSDLGYYLVMQFVEGETLSGLTSRAYARGVMLPRLVAVRIVLDTLLGLHAAHQLKDGEGRLLGLVHRDCTPQNILVGVDGSSRITDFGVARAAARLAITRPLTVKGKVAYLSPEQASAGELDRRSDIFTMGIVLWEVLAGRPLFTGDNDAAIVARLLTAPIPSLRNFVKDIPPELDEVCGRALQRLPSRRYATAAAMAEALERAALASLGGLGSHTDVGRCVEMLMGAELTTQREALNAWLAQNESAPLSRRRSAAELSSFVPGPPIVPNIALPARSPTPEAAKPSDPVEPAPPSTRDAAPTKDAAPGKTSVESPSMLSLPPRDPAAPSPSTPPPRTTSQRPAAPVAPAPAESAGFTVPSWVRKRISAIVVGLAVLLVAGSAPIWFPRANRLRHRLMGHPLPPTGTPRPRPSGAPRPRPSGASALSAAPAPAAPPPVAPE